MTASTLPAAVEPKALDELTRRRPTFRPGIPIVLGNGQSWHFPKPRMRYDPHFDEAGKISLRQSRVVLAPEIDAIVDRVVESQTDAEILTSALEMAYFALRMNYEVEPDELRHLVFYVSDDEANLEMWHELVAFARGDLYSRGEDDAPKPSAVGSGTTSSPTATTPTT